MAVAFVQGGTANAASVTITGVGAGSTLTVLVTCTGANTTSAVADGQGSYTKIGTTLTDGSNGIEYTLWQLKNANAGSHTVTATVSAGTPFYLFDEHSGADTTTPLDGINQAFVTANTTPIAAGIVTTTQANSVVVQMSFDIDALGAISSTGTLQFTSGGFTVADQTQASPGSVSPTITPSATSRWGVYAFGLKTPTGGAAPFIVNPTAGMSSSMVRSVGAAFIAANLLTSTLAPNQIPLPVRNNDSVQILQQHGPGIREQTNADTSRGMPRTLRGADAKLPAQDAPFLQADALAVRWSRPDTSKGVPRTLIGPDAKLPASDTPFLQADPKALLQVVNTSIGTNPNLFVPPSAPPIGKAAAYTQPKLLWQPAGTSQSAYALQFAPSVAALPPGQQTPFIQPDRVHQVADTNSMYAAIFGDANPVPVIQPLLPQIRWAWQNGDTSDSVTAAITPTGTVALPPGQATPWSFVQYRWQDGDTSDSVTAVLPIPLPAGKATPQSDPADNRWRAQDSSQGTPKPLYADATTPFFVEPHTAPDRIRPVTDTSTATNIAAIPPAAPPLPVGQQTPFIQLDRAHQVADTNSMYAAIFGDANPVPIIQPLLPQICWAWQNGDTSDSVTAAITVVGPPPLPPGQTTPTELVQYLRQTGDTSDTVTAILPLPAPFPVGAQWVTSSPYRFWFQPADTSQSLAKALTADATTPVSNLQQPVPDRFHPVSDTTLSSPLALIHPSVAPPVIPKKGGHFIPKKIRHETFEPERFDQQKQAELRRTIEEQFDVPEVQQAVAKYISRPAKAPNLRPSLNWPEIYKNFANIERSLREFEQKRQFEQHQIELARQAEIQDEEDLLRFL